MPRVIVYISEGNVQDVIADVPDVELMIVDYDHEEESPNRVRGFAQVRQDPTLFAKTIRHAENPPDCHLPPATT